MVNNELKKSLKETYVILNNLDDETFDKIPSETIELIKDNMDNDYEFEIDNSVSLSDQKLSNEALGIISVIYSKYICSDEEKEKWNEFDKFFVSKQEEKKKLEFGYNGLENNKNETKKIQSNYNEETKNTNENETNIIEYKKNTFFNKIINWFKNLFS